MVTSLNLFQCHNITHSTMYKNATEKRDAANFTKRHNEFFSVCVVWSGSTRAPQQMIYCPSFFRM